jgi:solute carrier family 5 (sodium/glucose cotransporter), member 9
LAGSLSGLIRFICEAYYTNPLERPLIISKIHYLHFSIILFTITIVVSVLVSLMNKPIDNKHVSYLKLSFSLTTTTTTKIKKIF